MRRKAAGEGNLRKRSQTVNRKLSNGGVSEHEYEFWEGRYTVEVNGKMTQKSLYGSTQEETRLKLQEVLNSINHSSYFEPSKMTYGEWLDTWLENFCVGVKPLTLKKYKTDVRIHVKPALEKIKLRDLKSLHIQKLINDLIDDGRAPKSIKSIHGVISKSLNVAVQQELIEKNPASLVNLPKIKQKKIVPLTTLQIKDLLDIVDADDYANELKLILFTGIREAECLGLTWDCVSFATNEITIDKQLVWFSKAEGGCKLQPTKSDKERIITVAPYVMDILRDQYKKQATEKIAAGEYWEGWKSERERRRALVFTGPTGNHLTAALLYSHYKALAKEIDAEYSTVHDLRHTFAVLSLENGDDVKTLQENLGHATAAFTLDRYGHVSNKMRKDSANRMQNYIESIG